MDSTEGSHGSLCMACPSQSVSNQLLLFELLCFPADVKSQFRRIPSISTGYLAASSGSLVLLPHLYVVVDVAKSSTSSSTTQAPSLVLRSCLL